MSSRLRRDGGSGGGGSGGGGSGGGKWPAGATPPPRTGTLQLGDGALAQRIGNG